MTKKTCENICNICGKPFYAGYQEDYDYCEQCRTLIDVKRNEIKDYKLSELIEYYDNAKEYAMSTSYEERMYRQQIAMVAIAKLFKNTHKKKLTYPNSDSLFSNLDNDVAEIRKRIERLKAKRNNLPVETKVVYKCIACGNQTNESFLCPSCQKKYKNKDVLIKITNGEKAEILDESYEGRYVCKDGHVVKSKSERDIDNYLYDHNITHAYEVDFPYGPNADEVIKPDFLLPHYLGPNRHVYIEHWGYDETNVVYAQTKKFKLPIYKNKKITLVCTHEKTDAKNINATLDRKLNKNFIKEKSINFNE